MTSPKDRIIELVQIINEANYNYHVLDNPTIEDQEYDKYLRELYTLEEKYPDVEIITMNGGQDIYDFIIIYE